MTSEIFLLLGAGLSKNERSNLAKNIAIDKTKSLEDILPQDSKRPRLEEPTKQIEDEAEEEEEYPSDTENIDIDDNFLQNIKKEILETVTTKKEDTFDNTPIVTNVKIESTNHACNRCDQIFEHHFEKVLHEKRIKGGCLYMCEECHFKSCTSDGLAIHQTTMHPNKKFNNEFLD